MAGSKVLLVEGRDEELVLPRLCQARGIDFSQSGISIRSKGGYTEILKGLKPEIKAAAGNGIEILGIVIDADDSKDSRWQAVRDRLIQSGYVHTPSGTRQERHHYPWR